MRCDRRELMGNDFVITIKPKGSKNAYCISTSCITVPFHDTLKLFDGKLVKIDITYTGLRLESEDELEVMIDGVMNLNNAVISFPGNLQLNKDIEAVEQLHLQTTNLIINNNIKQCKKLELKAEKINLNGGIYAEQAKINGGAITVSPGVLVRSPEMRLVCDSLLNCGSIISKQEQKIEAKSLVNLGNLTAGHFYADISQDLINKNGKIAARHNAEIIAENFINEGKIISRDNIQFHVEKYHDTNESEIRAKNSLLINATDADPLGELKAKNINLTVEQLKLTCNLEAKILNVEAGNLIVNNCANIVFPDSFDVEAATGEDFTENTLIVREKVLVSEGASLDLNQTRAEIGSGFTLAGKLTVSCSDVDCEGVYLIDATGSLATSHCRFVSAGLQSSGLVEVVDTYMSLNGMELNTGKISISDSQLKLKESLIQEKTGEMKFANVTVQAQQLNLDGRVSIAQSIVACQGHVKSLGEINFNNTTIEAEGLFQFGGNIKLDTSSIQTRASVVQVKSSDMNLIDSHINSKDLIVEGKIGMEKSQLEVREAVEIGDEAVFKLDRSQVNAKKVYHAGGIEINNGASITVKNNVETIKNSIIHGDVLKIQTNDFKNAGEIYEFKNFSMQSNSCVNEGKITALDMGLIAENTLNNKGYIGGDNLNLDTNYLYNNGKISSASQLMITSLIARNGMAGILYSPNSTIQALIYLNIIGAVSSFNFYKNTLIDINLGLEIPSLASLKDVLSLYKILNVTKMAMKTVCAPVGVTLDVAHRMYLLPMQVLGIILQAQTLGANGWEKFRLRRLLSLTLNAKNIALSMMNTAEDFKNMISTAYEITQSSLKMSKLQEALVENFNIEAFAKISQYVARESSRILMPLINQEALVNINAGITASFSINKMDIFGVNLGFEYAYNRLIHHSKHLFHALSTRAGEMILSADTFGSSGTTHASKTLRADFNTFSMGETAEFIGNGFVDIVIKESAKINGLVMLGNKQNGPSGRVVIGDRLVVEGQKADVVCEGVNIGAKVADVKAGLSLQGAEMKVEDMLNISKEAHVRLDNAGIKMKGVIHEGKMSVVNSGIMDADQRFEITKSGSIIGGQLQIKADDFAHHGNIKDAIGLVINTINTSIYGYMRANDLLIIADNWLYNKGRIHSENINIDTNFLTTMGIIEAGSNLSINCLIFVNGLVGIVTAPNTTIYSLLYVNAIGGVVSSFNMYKYTFLDLNILAVEMPSFASIGDIFTAQKIFAVTKMAVKVLSPSIGTLLEVGSRSVTLLGQIKNLYDTANSMREGGLENFRLRKLLPVAMNVKNIALSLHNTYYDISDMAKQGKKFVTSDFSWSKLSNIITENLDKDKLMQAGKFIAQESIGIFAPMMHHDSFFSYNSGRVYSYNINKIDFINLNYGHIYGYNRVMFETRYLRNGAKVSGKEQIYQVVKSVTNTKNGKMRGKRCMVKAQVMTNDGLVDLSDMISVDTIHTKNNGKMSAKLVSILADSTLQNTGDVKGSTIILDSNFITNAGLVDAGEYLSIISLSTFNKSAGIIAASNAVIYAPLFSSLGGTVAVYDLSLHTLVTLNVGLLIPRLPRWSDLCSPQKLLSIGLTAAKVLMPLPGKILGLALNSYRLVGQAKSIYSQSKALYDGGAEKFRYRKAFPIVVSAKGAVMSAVGICSEVEEIAATFSWSDLTKTSLADYSSNSFAQAAMDIGKKSFDILAPRISQSSILTLNAGYIRSYNVDMVDCLSVNFGVEYADGKLSHHSYYMYNANVMWANELDLSAQQFVNSGAVFAKSKLNVDFGEASITRDGKLIAPNAVEGKVRGNFVVNGKVVLGDALKNPSGSFTVGGTLELGNEAKFSVVGVDVRAAAVKLPSHLQEMQADNMISENMPKDKAVNIPSDESLQSVSVKMQDYGNEPQKEQIVAAPESTTAEDRKIQQHANELVHDCTSEEANQTHKVKNVALAEVASEKAEQLKSSLNQLDKQLKSDLNEKSTLESSIVEMQLERNSLDADIAAQEGNYQLIEAEMNEKTLISQQLAAVNSKIAIKQSIVSSMQSAINNVGKNAVGFFHNPKAGLSTSVKDAKQALKHLTDQGKALESRLNEIKERHVNKTRGGASIDLNSIRNRIDDLKNSRKVINKKIDNVKKRLAEFETKLRHSGVQANKGALNFAKGVSTSMKDIEKAINKAGGDISDEWKRLPPDVRKGIIIGVAAVGVYCGASLFLSAGGEFSLLVNLPQSGMTVKVVTYTSAGGVKVVPALGALVAALNTAESLPEIPSSESSEIAKRAIEKAKAKMGSNSESEKSLNDNNSDEFSDIELRFKGKGEKSTDTSSKQQQLPNNKDSQKTDSRTKNSRPIGPANISPPPATTRSKTQIPDSRGEVDLSRPSERYKKSPVEPEDYSDFSSDSPHGKTKPPTKPTDLSANKWSKFVDKTKRGNAPPPDNRHDKVLGSANPGPSQRGNRTILGIDIIGIVNDMVNLVSDTTNSAVEVLQGSVIGRHGGCDGPVIHHPNSDPDLKCALDKERKAKERANEQYDDLKNKIERY